MDAPNKYGTYYEDDVAFTRGNFMEKLELVRYNEVRGKEICRAGCRGWGSEHPWWVVDVG